MGDERDKLTREELIEQNRKLREENERLRGQVEALEAALRKARKDMEELQRTSKRQAAPFRKPEEKKKSDNNKCSPGRKKGHRGTSRQKPDRVDQERKVPLEQCPHCGGEVSDVRPVEQFIQDIPLPRVRTTRVITESGWCPRCGKRVRSTDPQQVSSATGAAGVHVGANAIALAAYFKYVLGLTYRKISSVLKVFGLEITPGGIVQALHRAAANMVSSWFDIWKQIRAGPTVHSDETSWYVGASGWWLWVFCRPRWSLYVVDQSRGSDVVDRILEDFDGTLVSDCLSTYDPIDCRKQKCYSHHLKAISDAIERLPEESEEVLKELKTLLITAMALGRCRNKMSQKVFCNRRDRLEKWADRILEEGHTEPGVEKVLERFRKQREHLFTFLYDASVPATNNLAERQLRPAVIARKLSCGNKTDKGRITWQMLASIAATCRQQGRPFLKLVRQAMHLEAPPPRLAPTGG